MTRREWAWASYDWANSAFPTVVSTFVIAAYAVTALGTFGVLIFSWLRMRAAEARVAAMTQDRD